MEIKMFTYARKYYRLGLTLLSLLLLYALFVQAKNKYTNPDFGNTFGKKASLAKQKLNELNESFTLCSKLCNKSIVFMKSIVFPEVMRYNTLKDDIETESLKTLYVLLGKDYANFSMGIFQMKPSFAAFLEEKSKTLLDSAVYAELELAYPYESEKRIREERIERLHDDDYQLVYLTAFILVCDQIYQKKHFATEVEKMQWYATIYNAGFNKLDAYIEKKIEQENFYLQQNMPEKKFRYAAIATWYYEGNAVP